MGRVIAGKIAGCDPCHIGPRMHAHLCAFFHHTPLADKKEIRRARGNAALLWQVCVNPARRHPSRPGQIGFIINGSGHLTQNDCINLGMCAEDIFELLWSVRVDQPAHMQLVSIHAKLRCINVIFVDCEKEHREGPIQTAKSCGHDGECDQ